MVPSKVSNRKTAVPVLTTFETVFETENEGIAFPMVMLKTSPVGEPGTVVPGAGGMVTTSPCFWPAPLYRVDLPVTLSLTQKGLHILCDRHKLRVGWVKVHGEQLEFQHERLLSR